MTADTGTIGEIFISGANTLDHDDILKIGCAFVLQIFGHFNLGHDAAVLTITVLFGFIFMGSCCNNNHTVINFSFVHGRAHQYLCSEVPFKSTEPDDEGFGQHLNFIVVGNVFDQAHQKILDIIPFNGACQFPGKTTQVGFFFNNHHFKTLICQSLCSGHS